MTIYMQFYMEYILLLVLIVVSAFTSMSEAALLSVSKFKVRNWVEKNKFGAVYAKKLKDNPERLLSTLLVGNNLTNTAAAAITTSIAIKLFQNNAVGIAIGIAAFIILVFGDIVPKSIGTNNNEALSTVVAPVVWYLSIAMYPLIKALDYFLKAINKLIGTKQMSIITKDELKTIIKSVEEGGSIKQTEKKLVQRIFESESTTVGDVMTRKKGIVSVSSDMKISDVLKLQTVKLFQISRIRKKQGQYCRSAVPEGHAKFN